VPERWPRLLAAGAAQSALPDKAGAAIGINRALWRWFWTIGSE